METVSKYSELAKRIYQFLDEYAVKRPDCDDDEKFTSPDASMLQYCADMLSKGVLPTRCWSDWGSGGYKPYSSKTGRDEHDAILEQVYKLINK